MKIVHRLTDRQRELIAEDVAIIQEAARAQQRVRRAVDALADALDLDPDGLMVTATGDALYREEGDDGDATG